MATPSIREMKDALTSAGVSFADCSEKPELIARYQSAMANSARSRAGAATGKASMRCPNVSQRKAPPKQLSIEEMGKEADGSDGGELGAEIRRVCSSTNFYEILKVERSCKEEDLKKAYRKLALRLHPDKCHLSGAEEAFKKVSTAFSCLHNAQQRASYDIHGEEVVKGGPTGYGGGFRGDVDAEELYRTFCGARTEGGFNIAHIAAAMKNNPWLVLAFFTEPPMYPVGSVLVLGMLSQIFYIMEAVVQRPYLLALLAVPIAGYFLCPDHLGEQVRRRIEQSARFEAREKL